MKDRITIASLHEDAVKALKESRLLDALLTLDGLAVYLEHVSLKEKSSMIRTSYSMLLDYMERGVTDPERNHLYHRFVRECYEATDYAYREYLLSDKTLHYANIWRTLEKMQQNSSLSEVIQKTYSHRLLFEVSWVSPTWQTADYEAAHNIITTNDTNEANNCMLISGATLGALQVFDALRLKFLIDLVSSSSLTIRIRALVGMTMICLKHHERITLYPELEEKLSQIHTIPGISEALQALQMQLFLTLETRNIEKSLSEEIIPEVIKEAHKAKQESVLNFEELQEKIADNELNPEWENNKSSSTLARKMRELTEMQMKGADVFMGSFKVLKQKFPFFNIAANWFLPFRSGIVPEIEQVMQEFPFAKQVLANGNLCDSDKYSFCLFLKDLPPLQNKMIKQQLDAAMQNVPENKMSLKTLEEEKDETQLIRSYIQDMYRFFHLFHYRCTDDNPFHGKLLITEIRSLQAILSAPAILRTLADFAFTEKNYLYALPLYHMLPHEAGVFERIGFCYQSNAQFKEATQAYEKAYLLKPNSTWTLRQLAYCYRKQSNFKAAQHYYEELEMLEPDRISHLLSLSECYLHFKNYDKAFEKLHKADYLSPQTGMAVKALAWCSLITGKLKQAERYYKKILEYNATATDYFNAGHVAWLQGNIRQAIDHYHTSLRMTQSKYAPANYFDEDAPVLEQQGLTKTDLHIMIDLLNKNQY